MRISDWSSDVCSSDLDLLQAFDTAARIHDGASIALPPDSGDGAGADTSAKHPALRQVAVAAAAQDERRLALRDRKRVVNGESVSARIDLDGRRILQKKKSIIE